MTFEEALKTYNSIEDCEQNHGKQSTETWKSWTKTLPAGLTSSS